MRPRLAAVFSPELTVDDLRAYRDAGIDGGLLLARPWMQATERLAELRQHTLTLGLSLAAIMDDGTLAEDELLTLAERARCRCIISARSCTKLLAAGYHVSRITTNPSEKNDAQPQHLILSDMEAFPSDWYQPQLTSVSLDQPIIPEEKFLPLCTQHPALEWLIFFHLDLSDPAFTAGLQQTRMTLLALAQKNAKRHCRAGACP
jgi:hypothetical protein